VPAHECRERLPVAALGEAIDQFAVGQFADPAGFGQTPRALDQESRCPVRHDAPPFENRLPLCCPNPANRPTFSSKSPAGVNPGPFRTRPPLFGGRNVPQ
jgi:hypothetical protein